MSEELLGLGGQAKLRDTDPAFNPRTAAEWAEKCNLDYQAGMNVEGKSWGHLRHGLCTYCANLFADAYACEQVEAFRERAAAALCPRCARGEQPDGYYRGKLAHSGDTDVCPAAAIRALRKP